MKPTLPNIRKLAGRGRTENSADSGDINDNQIETDEAAEPKLGAFAGSLNALDFPVQLLVRQHPPVLQTLRDTLAEAQPEDLPQQTREAAESLGRLLGTLESREGILDRRFYAICEHARADELRGLLSRAGLGVFPLKGQPLKLLLLASALGGSPSERDEEEELSVEVNRRDIRVGGHLVRSLHLGKWPPASSRA